MKKFEVSFTQISYEMMRRMDITTNVYADDEEDAEEEIHGQYSGEIIIKSVKRIK